MFLNTFTDAGELIYVRTKDCLFSNLGSHVFDFFGEEGNTFFLSQEANRAPAIKKTNIYSIYHHDLTCFTIQPLL